MLWRNAQPTTAAGVASRGDGRDPGAAVDQEEGPGLGRDPGAAVDREGGPGLGQGTPPEGRVRRIEET